MQTECTEVREAGEDANMMTDLLPPGGTLGCVDLALLKMERESWAWPSVPPPDAPFELGGREGTLVQGVN